MKKCIGFVAVVLTLVFSLGGCALFEPPAYAKPFSGDAVNAALTEMIINGETERTFAFTDMPEEASSELTEILNERYETDGLFLYYVAQITNTVMPDILYGEITFEIDYNSSVVPYAEIDVAENDLEAVEAIIENLEEGKSETVLLCPKGGYDGAEAFMLGDCADLNANQPCSTDSINYQVFPEIDTENQLLIIGYVYSVDEATRRSVSEQVDAAVIAKAKEISDADYYATDAELYRAIHDAVIDSAYYDYELYDVIGEGEMTDEQKIGKCAYGLLIEGKSVCSGYAYTFKALCDYFELPCWVVSCNYNSDGHVLNIVSLDGETYYVDCTFDDTGYNSHEYFMFTADSYQYGEYEFNTANVMPW